MILWDVDTGRKLKLIGDAKSTTILPVFLPDGRRAVAASGNTVRLWDTETGQELRPPVGHTAAVTSVSFSPDSRYVLSGSGQDHTVRLWDVKSGAEKWRSPRGAQFWYAFVAADGSRAIAYESRNEATHCFIDLESGRELAEKKWAGGGAVLSPDHRRVAANMMFGAEDGSIKNKNIVHVYDVDSRKLLYEFTEFPGEGSFFWLDRKLLYIDAKDSQAIVVDVETGKEVRRIKSLGLLGLVQLDGHNGYFHSGSDVLRIDFSGPEPKRHDFLRWHDGANVNSIALAPDGKTLVSSDTVGRVIVWNTAKGDKTHEWKIEGGVNGVAIAADGRHIATANGNGTIYILRLGAAAAKK